MKKKHNKTKRPTHGHKTDAHCNCDHDELALTDVQLNVIKEAIEELIGVLPPGTDVTVVIHNSHSLPPLNGLMTNANDLMPSLSILTDATEEQMAEEPIDAKAVVAELKKQGLIETMLDDKGNELVRLTAKGKDPKVLEEIARKAGFGSMKEMQDTFTKGL